MGALGGTVGARDEGVVMFGLDVPGRIDGTAGDIDADADDDVVDDDDDVA